MHIIGGGVIGLCCAWYLTEAGYTVTIVDKSEFSEGCSYGNSGLIVPSHFTPLAAPGVVTHGMRWLLRKDSPFFIKPSADPSLLQWLWRFYRSSTAEHVDKASPVLCAMHLKSKELYGQLSGIPGFDFDLASKGLYMLYQTEKARKEELKLAERARHMGMEAQECPAAEIEETLGTVCKVLGGVLYPGDGHLDPSLFMQRMQTALHRKGVRFLSGKEVIDFEVNNRIVTGLKFSDGSTQPVADVLLASGARSAALAEKLGTRLLIQPGRGYSMTFEKGIPQMPVPSILTEARVAVTPLSRGLRVGGTMSIAGFSQQVQTTRVQGILNAMHHYFPEFAQRVVSGEKVWQGFRPVSADGLPYIGRIRRYKNVLVATGHAMLGMSLGPVTGSLIAEIAQGKSPEIPLELFAVERH